MSKVLVRLSQQKLNDYKWLMPLEDLVNVLPHGSGFDSDWKFHFSQYDYPDRIMLSNSYHAMDGNGMYSGWLHFNIFVGRPGYKNEEFYQSSKWYHTFEINFDASDLDYDELYPEGDGDIDEDWEDIEFTGVDKDSLEEYISDTICNALQGITFAQIVPDDYEKPTEPDKIMYDYSDDVDNEDLEAAAEMYDSLVDGTFYKKQAEAEQWLRNQSRDEKYAWDAVRRDLDNQSIQLEEIESDGECVENDYDDPAWDLQIYQFVAKQFTTEQFSILCESVYYRTWAYA